MGDVAHVTNQRKNSVPADFGRETRARVANSVVGVVSVNPPERLIDFVLIVARNTGV